MAMKSVTRQVVGLGDGVLPKTVDIPTTGQIDRNDNQLLYRQGDQGTSDLASLHAGKYINPN
jgi:hypothetical protein